MRAETAEEDKAYKISARQYMGGEPTSRIAKSQCDLGPWCCVWAVLVHIIRAVLAFDARAVKQG
jgi:hypothetical protein